jgi:hypothetical protein
MVSPQSYVIPLVALLATGGLAQVLRWTYGAPGATQPREVDGTDFGLLREVATVADAAEADGLRALLNDEGIRSTVSRARAGRVLVLVFAADLDRARQLVGPR